MLATFSLSPAFMDAPVQVCVKVLDLLTNRYHAGIVRSATEDGMEIELPLTARLSPGQRIRFALDDASGLIARRTMQRGIVRHVEPTDDSHLRVEVSTAGELQLA